MRNLSSKQGAAEIEIPPAGDAQVQFPGGRTVRLTNLDKVFWNGPRYTKGDLLRYYADMSDVLVPHLRSRAMVMKRYPNGAAEPPFFMKRTPKPHPEWLETCRIVHRSGNVIDFPMVQDTPSLLWTVNLGCIDLNPWYARCDDVDRPDALYFDLDPGPGASFARVREVALLVRDALKLLGMTCFAKTTGSRGIHIAVPLVRGPVQKRVWEFAKAFAQTLEAQAPQLITAEYRVAKRPPGRVLVDYNQNAWGRTLASIYSVRPTPAATVSAPVTWEEVEGGVELAEFDLRTMSPRIASVGDLWRPVLGARGRVDLEAILEQTGAPRTRRRSSGAGRAK
jgi:bifunctional non-homologous end joining protein LigD